MVTRSGMRTPEYETNRHRVAYHNKQAELRYRGGKSPLDRIGLYIEPGPKGNDAVIQIAREKLNRTMKHGDGARSVA